MGVAVGRAAPGGIGGRAVVSDRWNVSELSRRQLERVLKARFADRCLDCGGVDAWL